MDSLLKVMRALEEWPLEKELILSAFQADVDVYGYDKAKELWFSSNGQYKWPDYVGIKEWPRKWDNCSGVQNYMDINKFSDQEIMAALSTKFIGITELCNYYNKLEQEYGEVKAREIWAVMFGQKDSNTDKLIDRITSMFDEFI